MATSYTFLDLFSHAKSYIKQKNYSINYNILEMVCRYNHLVQHPFTQEKLLLQELKKYYNAKTCNQILHILRAFKKGPNAQLYLDCQIYYDALLYSIKQLQNQNG